MSHASAARARRIPPGAIKVPVPEALQQQDHTCGAAAVRAVCLRYGIDELDEPTVVAAMRMGPDGSDPVHLVRALRRHGLAHVERRGMTDAELRAWLDGGRPVIVMLQAWGARRSYRRHFRDGHWVVVIGHDREGVYLADPLLAGVRGFLTWAQLADRWHDLEGRTRRHVERYGLVAWGRRARRTEVSRRARALP